VTKFFLPFILAAGMHAAYAQPRYTVTEICECIANGINNNGDVCGSLANNHTFLYKKGKITDLGVWMDAYPKDSDSTQALALNNSDFVVGSFYDGPSGGGLRTIPSLI
jgi:probable HAF family extracellular repeat protein